MGEPKVASGTTCDEALHERSPLRRALSEHFRNYSGVIVPHAVMPLVHHSVADVINEQEQEFLSRDSASGAQA